MRYVGPFGLPTSLTIYNLIRLKIFIVFVKLFYHYDFFFLFSIFFFLHLMQVNLPVNILLVSYPQNHSQATHTPDEVPKTVVRTLNQGSTPMSMDFHPTLETLLLGDLSLNGLKLLFLLLLGFI